MENSRGCKICKVDVHRTSMPKQLRNNKPLREENKLKRLYQIVYLKKSKHLSGKKIKTYITLIQ